MEIQALHDLLLGNITEYILHAHHLQQVAQQKDCLLYDGAAVDWGDELCDGRLGLRLSFLNFVFFFLCQLWLLFLGGLWLRLTGRNRLDNLLLFLLLLFNRIDCFRHLRFDMVLEEKVQVTKIGVQISPIGLLLRELFQLRFRALGT